ASRLVNAWGSDLTCSSHYAPPKSGFSAMIPFLAFVLSVDFFLTSATGFAMTKYRSPFSGSFEEEIVNDEFEEALRDALRRGVRVWLGYGFDKGSTRGQEQREDPKWRTAERRLTALQKHFPDKLVFKDIGYSHEKRLICDNRFTFGGSFNFLSFSGEQRG